MQDTALQQTSPAHGAAPSGGRARFLAAFQSSIAEHSFDKLVLSRHRGAETGLHRVSVRPLRLKERDCLSFVYSHATRDITKNFPLTEGLDTLDSLIAHDFSHAHLLTAKGDWELRVSRKGKETLLRGSQKQLPEKAPEAAPPSEHDRAKHRWVDPGRPFLRELGVVDAQQRLVPAMARKWKQINKFVEVFDRALAASPLAAEGGSPTGPVRVVDFGSGKGYLTFAVHDHLSHSLGLTGTQVTGVELRRDLVDLCGEVVHRLGIRGLHFDAGDVRSYTPAAIDVMIALHACDTATDHAIHLGVRAGAAVIMCSPCCHKQIRPQLLSPHPLRPLLRHGVHLGQEAEMVTDGLRALLLEAAGYDTQVFEFISLEHTAKNKMILAVKRADAAPAEEILVQIAEIKAFYGIKEHCLETLLRPPAPGR